MAKSKKHEKDRDLDSGPPKPSVLPLPAPAPKAPGLDDELDEMDDLDEGMEIPDLPEPETGKPGKGPEAPKPKPPKHDAEMKPGSAPPLFVKVEKYEDVVKNLQELRSYAMSLRDALDALADIEKEMKIGMEVAHKALDRVNALLSLLDSKLLRTKGVDIEGELKAPKEVEGYIKNVYNQIERLKSELQAIE